MADRHQLELAIAAQEALRGTVPDDVIDVTLDALRRRLAVLGPETQQRRQVTVLFADVSGFTAISESLDAELVANMMNEIWALVDVVITEHGGRIDKHIGDSVMAVWGAEKGEENDAERAVRAGLALQDTMLAFVAEPGVAVAMRVGLSTGQVLIGAVGTTAEQTAMGDTVNVASRMEHHAPVGAVLISHDTYRTVRGVFDVRPAGELAVKGKYAPVRAYVVERAKPRAFRVATRGVEGVETRTIGREAELAVLREAYADVQAAGLARVTTVVAEAGAGKSRLLYEFLNWVELEPSRTYLFTGRALANRQTVARGLCRDVVATRFDISDSDSPATVVWKLREGFASHLDASKADVVGHWLGFEMSPAGAPPFRGAELASTARTHLIEYLGSLAADETMVLALEDLHWADDESLDLVLDLVTRLTSHHLLVLGLSRPTLYDRRPDWPGEGMAAARLDLAPLSNTASQALVREVLQRVDDLSEELVELVASRADGNAFYIEELVKMLIDEGAIDVSEIDHWRVDLSRLDSSGVPSTLTGVLQARLDSLAAIERRTLQCASIMGRVFWGAAVEALADVGGTEAVLEAVGRRDLVFRRAQSSFAETAEYLFKHALLCDVTYETVLIRDRQPLHARAASWLEETAGERVAEYQEMIAAHHQAAGQRAAAADHLWRAGEHYLTTGTPAAARRSLEAAVELWSTTAHTPPAEAVILLADACLDLDDLDAAEAALASASEFATELSARAHVSLLSGRAASYRGQLELERSHLDQALLLAETLGDRILARTLALRAWSEAQVGTLEEAERYAQRALQLAEQLGDMAEVFRALGSVGVIAAERGELKASLGFAERQAAIGHASGNLDQQAIAHSNIGVMLHLLGDATGDRSYYPNALTHYELASGLNRRLNQPANVVRTIVNQAQVRVRLGRFDEAGELIRDAVIATRSLGQPPIECLCLEIEADRLITKGDVDVGLMYLGAILAHPASGGIDRQEIDRILGRTSLSPDEIEAGLAAGAGLELEAALRTVLADNG